MANPFLSQQPSTSSNPFLSSSEPEKRDDKQFYDGTAVGELGEGIVSGAIGIGEGVAGLGAIVADTIFDTSYGDRVTETAEAARDALGLDPEGFLGKGAEVVT
jgi:hypothetical protein